MKMKNKMVVGLVTLASVAFSLSSAKAIDYDISSTGGSWTVAGSWLPASGSATSTASDTITIDSISGTRTITLDGTGPLTYTVSSLSFNDDNNAVFQSLASGGAKTLAVTNDLTKDNTGSLTFTGNSGGGSMNVKTCRPIWIAPRSSFAQ